MEMILLALERSGANGRLPKRDQGSGQIAELSDFFSSPDPLFSEAGTEERPPEMTYVDLSASPLA